MGVISPFFARDTDRAVILRQGPSKQFRMILWHRDTDTFEDGQWIKQKIYTERCDLSPDGEHFVYFTLDGKWKPPSHGTYTVISKPPYWTAIALFPLGDTWSGGGAFLDARHYFADGGSDIIKRTNRIHRVFLAKPDKGCSTGLRLETGGRAPLDRAATKRLLADPAPSGPAELRDRMPISHDPEVDKYLTKEGEFFRYQNETLELIRDFTDMSFVPIRAPYDWRQDAVTGEAQPWHPLEGKNR